MIDINYVQNKLDTESIDSTLPLRSWCRDLITEIRKLGIVADSTTLTVSLFKAKIQDLKDRMMLASDAFDEDNFVTGMSLLRHEVDKDEG